jgi:hypothetical protein
MPPSGNNGQGMAELELHGPSGSVPGWLRWGLVGGAAGLAVPGA